MSGKILRFRELLPGNEGCNMVRMKGLEPPRLSAPDPKSGAAANYATSADSFSGFEPIQFVFSKRSANL